MQKISQIYTHFHDPWILRLFVCGVLLIMLTLNRVEEPKPLSIPALKQFIAKALDKGWIRESFHSEVERADRNISDDDLRYGLESDWTLEEARYSQEHDGFSYKLKTIDLDDEELHIVVCPMLASQTLKVITKW